MIIETGTADGGSALYLAAICDLIGHGRIYSIDIADRTSLQVHPRVEYLSGSSTSDEIHATLRARIRRGERVLVTLRAAAAERDQYTRGLESALQTIYGSRWWRAAQWYRGLRNLLRGRAKRTQ